MHFEFLTEDQSSGKAMEILIPQLLGVGGSYRIRSYKGLGRIPKGLRPTSDANKRILLDRLPHILRGYGHNPNCGIIVIICDLDDKNENMFRSELQGILNACNPKPQTLFCLAIEEFEAWYLGDLNAVRKAYPKAIEKILKRYKNDSICGTWETLADAVYNGGHKALASKGWQAVGKQKFIWAKDISPHMDVDKNESPSFKFLRSELKKVMADNA
jgi:hypothetical protein